METFTKEQLIERFKLIDDVIHSNNLKLFGCAAKKLGQQRQAAVDLPELGLFLFGTFSHGFTLPARLEMESWRSSSATKIRLHLSVMVVNPAYV